MTSTAFGTRSASHADPRDTEAVSRDDVAVLRKGYAAVNRGDIEGLLESVHPDVEFTSLIAEAEGEVFKGHEGVRRWWEQVVIPLGGLHGEIEEVRDLGGDRLLARVAGTYRPSGVEVHQTVWNVTRFRDGKATGWEFFRTEDEAVEAAGQSAG
jgi:ketosteroid isomerase-like protein